MIGEPRTLARIVELFHIPLQHDMDQLRDVYLQVSNSCGYDNFTRQPGGAYLEAAAGESGGVSRVVFLKDRIRFREERTRGTVETFRKRMEQVIQVVTEKLSIPVFIIRNITVRAVCAAPSGQSAPRFITENLFDIDGDDFNVMGRPTQIIGMRMHIPPTDQDEGAHQIRIESYLRDQRSLFVEDVATFKVPVQSRDRDRINAELDEVEDFVQERVSGFLNQFPR